MRFITILALAGCAGGIDIIHHCDPIGPATPLCGYHNPEDLDRLPDPTGVLVSEYGGMAGEEPGVLARLDLETLERSVLYEGSDETGPGSWGDPACPGAPGDAFSPHGVHVSQRADGAWQILAVNHGGRESIEWFEVLDPDTVAWRGCAVAPEKSMLNNLIATADGEVYATHMMTRRSGVGQSLAFLNAQLFGKGGHVYRWTPEVGFEELEGSEGGIANGIALHPDGDSLFVAYSLSGELRQLSLAGDVLGSATFEPIDNLTWAPDGRLIAATSLEKGKKMMACTKIEEGICLGAHAIEAIDPDTFASETLYEGGPGTPGGAGTTGLIAQDGSLLVGTFAGDRVVKVDLE